MVVLLDLDDGALDPLKGVVPKPWIRPTPLPEVHLSRDSVPNPNANGFSAILACYPVVTELASLIDLNTLHALSRTCRQFRANLLQFRSQLIPRTLKCVNDISDSDDDSGGSGNHAWRYKNTTIARSRYSTGKIGPCARDLNCTMKPPSATSLRNRHRRLCTACVKAPMSMIAGCETTLDTFTSMAFLRTPCACRDFVYLCQPCGVSLSSEDITYRRIWTWRTRYSTYLGGLGTGIGEGNEGVKCGRGTDCLAAEDIELEMDCGAQELSTAAWEVDKAGKEGAAMRGATGGEEKAGYLRQEIEGIGGIVRKKVKKRVRVGKTVKEYEDERERAEYLGREMSGESRSWCGWCDRVVPGQGDS